MQKNYRYHTKVEKLLCLTKHSRPDIANAVRELGRHCHNAMKTHWDSMCKCIRYARPTLTRGLMFMPTGNCDGKDKNFKFKIRRTSDLNYVTDPDSRRSVLDTFVYLSYVSIAFSSVTEKHAYLILKWNVEQTVFVTMVQDMMYVYRVFHSWLHTELPMSADMENSGVRDLVDSCSICGRTSMLMCA